MIGAKIAVPNLLPWLGRGPSLTGYLLEDYPGAAAAYSVRLLDSTYTGSAIRVRESSGGTEADIGFDASGNLDETALLAHCGANDGFVTKWYDQSGGGYDAIQSTGGSQPKIVSSGTVVKKNGRPAMDFDGVNDSLATTGYIVELSANNATVLAVVDATSSEYILAEADGASPYSSNFILGGPSGPNETLWVNATEFGTLITGHKLVGFTYDGINFQAYQNGATNGASGTATVNSEALNKTVLGSRGDQSIDFYTGKIQELITYKSDKTADISGISTNINGYFSIYP